MPSGGRSTGNGRRWIHPAAVVARRRAYPRNLAPRAAGVAKRVGHVTLPAWHARRADRPPFTHQRSQVSCGTSPTGIAERNLTITERHRSGAVLGIARCSRSRCRSGISIPAPPLPECSVSTWTRNFEGLPRAHGGLLTLLEIRQSENPGPRMNSPMTSREGSIMVTFHCSGGRNSVYVDGRGVAPANGAPADPAHRTSIGKD